MREDWQHLQMLGKQVWQKGSAREQQAHWLSECLNRNRETEYGRHCGFDTVHTIEAFRAQVPVVDYQDLVPWIERAANGEADILFAGVPVTFECTGGSTGGSKRIPYSTSSLADFRVAILPWLSDVIDTYGFGEGCAYWAISPAVRGSKQTAGGIPIGLPDAAYLGNDAIEAFIGTLALPERVGAITNFNDWQLVTLYWLIRREDIELISVWSPTYLLSLITTLKQRAAEIEAIFLDGIEISGLELPSHLPAYRRLQEYLESHDTKRLWPKLKLVSCWADASSRPFFDELRMQIPHADFQPKGLMSTEGVVTVPDKEGRPVLATRSGFYEFIDDGDAIWLAHELKHGECYEVVMTTSGGLYRYRTGDRVICEGYAGELPILRFSGRRGVVSDLVGEKLTDDFIAKCLKNIPGFRMLVPSVDGTPKYILVLDDCSDIAAEPLILSLEAALSKNPQYAYARRLGQLAPVEVRYISDPLKTFIAHNVDRGTSIGDVKMPSLCPDLNILETFRETTT